MNANLIAEAESAWAADDGQSTHRDIASRVLRRAVASGALPSNHKYEDALEAALVAATASQVGVVESIHPMDAARRKAELEWQAVVEAAKRPVTVYDEDGGTSVEMRVPEGWDHHGCRSFGEYLRKAAPVNDGAESAKMAEADAEAAAFVAELPTLDAASAKARYWGLSRGARNSPAIRNLPKAVRRNF